MTALLVEDEELAVRKLQKLLHEVAPTLTVLATTPSIEETVDWLETNRAAGQPEPDLLFLDIELADGQSFEIFERTTVWSTIIFTTSYDEYALQAFKVNSIDYLLKPIQKEDLQRSLDKFEALRGQPAETPDQQVEKLLRALQGQTPRTYRQRFLVKQGQRMLSVSVDDIGYFYTDDRYSFFVTHANQRYLVDYTLDELADALDPAHFFRINRGVLLTHRVVDQIQPYFGNRLALTLRPAFDREALVSRERVSDFKQWMGK
jgi:DNA-binding LytR/AlgR family response regulator